MNMSAPSLLSDVRRRGRSTALLPALMVAIATMIPFEARGAELTKNQLFLTVESSGVRMCMIADLDDEGASAGALSALPLAGSLRSIRRTERHLSWRFAGDPALLERPEERCADPSPRAPLVFEVTVGPGSSVERLTPDRVAALTRRIGRLLIGLART
jgi:hypothetical protein